MLILTRGLNEKILIDNGKICIQVVGVGRKVRLGITAPENVRIQREEIARQDVVSMEPSRKGISPATDLRKQFVKDGRGRMRAG